MQLKIMKKYTLNKKTAFTLAEVLITLGIIGVVAALTIPTLMQNSKDKATVSALKKAYSMISQAYMMAVQENGTPDEWDLGGMGDAQGAKNMQNVISPYLRISKNCGNVGGCWATGFAKQLDGTDSTTDHNVSAFATSQLPDGSDISFDIHSKDCSADYGVAGSTALKQVCATMNIDIDGMKGKNQYGSDVFVFWITKTGIVPFGIKDDAWFGTACNRATGKSGYGCAAWVIYNENMDYFKCDTLSWSGPTKCN